MERGGGKASTVSIGQQANKIQLANRDVWQNWFQRPLPGCTRSLLPVRQAA